MPSLAGHMRHVDPIIFDKIGETMRIDNSSNPIQGIFFNRHREVELLDHTVVGLNISFDCQFSSYIAELEEDDLVDIYADATLLGTFRFIRRIPPDGDESGKVTLELGSV